MPTTLLQRPSCWGSVFHPAPKLSREDHRPPPIPAPPLLLDHCASLSSNLCFRPSPPETRRPFSLLGVPAAPHFSWAYPKPYFPRRRLLNILLSKSLSLLHGCHGLTLSIYLFLIEMAFPHQNTHPSRATSSVAFSTFARL